MLYPMKIFCVDQTESMSIYCQWCYEKICIHCILKMYKRYLRFQQSHGHRLTFSTVQNYESSECKHNQNMNLKNIQSLTIFDYTFNLIGNFNICLILSNQYSDYVVII